MSACGVVLNVDDEDFDGRRSDVCRVSVKKIGGDGSEICVRIVVEVVDVLTRWWRLTDIGWRHGNWWSWCWNEGGLDALESFLTIA